VIDALAAIERWTLAKHGRTAIIDIDNGCGDTVYCVRLDDQDRTGRMIFQHEQPASTLDEAVRLAVEAIRQSNQ
jgi:hypothetical protein